MKLLDDGREPPPMYYDHPEIPEWQQFYWRAFADLSTERQIGMSLGPIPRSQIMEYAAEHRLGADAKDRLIEIIRTMDNEYLKLLSSQSKSRKEADEEVSVLDIEGNKQLLARVKARAGSARKPHGKS